MPRDLRLMPLHWRNSSWTISKANKQWSCWCVSNDISLHMNHKFFQPTMIIARPETVEASMCITHSQHQIRKIGNMIFAASLALAYICRLVHCNDDRITLAGKPSSWTVPKIICKHIRQLQMGLGNWSPAAFWIGTCEAVSWISHKQEPGPRLGSCPACEDRRFASFGVTPLIGIYVKIAIGHSGNLSKCILHAIDVFCLDRLG